MNREFAAQGYGLSSKTLQLSSFLNEHLQWYSRQQCVGFGTEPYLYLKNRRAAVTGNLELSEIEPATTNRLDTVCEPHKASILWRNPPEVRRLA